MTSFAPSIRFARFQPACGLVCIQSVRQHYTFLLMSPFAYLIPLVVWVGVLLVCLLCIYVAWRALFGDRGGGKRRCPKCWYDMAYSPSMTCAECGHIVSVEANFQRTRRRPGVAAAAIFICVALVLAVNDQMNERGMLRHIPTGLLIWILPISGGMDGSIGREIDRRGVARELSPEQWVRLLERCADGGWTSSPPSDDWIDDYGNYITSWRLRFINDATLEAPLIHIPARFDVKTRDVWPEGAAPALAVRLEDWWPAGMECRIRAAPRVQGASPLTFYRSGEVRFRPSPFTMYLPPLPRGENDIVIDFQVDRRRIAELAQDRAATQVHRPADGASGPHDASGVELADDGWESVGTYSVTLKTTVEGRIEDLMQPVSSASLDALMQQVFGNAVRWTGGGLSPVRFGINVPATFAPEFDDTAVGVSVELQRDGVVARRLDLWWIAGSGVPDHGRNYGFEINYENLEMLRQLQEEGGWSLHVRGDPLIALRAGAARQFWKGELSLPISLRTNETQAPPRLWWVEGEEGEPVAADEEAPPRSGRRSR